MPRNVAYHLTNEDRETLIRWNAAHKTVVIDSADSAVIRKLDRLCEKHPEVYACMFIDEKFGAKRYRLTDYHYIRFAWPASEAARDAARKRAEATGNLSKRA